MTQSQQHQQHVRTPPQTSHQQPWRGVSECQRGEMAPTESRRPASVGVMGRHGDSLLDGNPEELTVEGHYCGTNSGAKDGEVDRYGVVSKKQFSRAAAFGSNSSLPSVGRQLEEDSERRQVAHPHPTTKGGRPETDRAPRGAAASSSLLTTSNNQREKMPRYNATRTAAAPPAPQQRRRGKQQYESSAASQRLLREGDRLPHHQQHSSKSSGRGGGGDGETAGFSGKSGKMGRATAGKLRVLLSKGDEMSDDGVACPADAEGGLLLPGGGESHDGWVTAKAGCDHVASPEVCSGEKSSINSSSQQLPCSPRQRQLSEQCHDRQQMPCPSEGFVVIVGGDEEEGRGGNAFCLDEDESENELDEGEDDEDREDDGDDEDDDDEDSDCSNRVYPGEVAVGKRGGWNGRHRIGEEGLAYRVGVDVQGEGHRGWEEEEGEGNMAHCSSKSIDRTAKTGPSDGHGAAAAATSMEERCFIGDGQASMSAGHVPLFNRPNANAATSSPDIQGHPFQQQQQHAQFLPLRRKMDESAANPSVHGRTSSQHGSSTTVSRTVEPLQSRRQRRPAPPTAAAAAQRLDSSSLRRQIESGNRRECPSSPQPSSARSPPERRLARTARQHQNPTVSSSRLEESHSFVSEMSTRQHPQAASRTEGEGEGVRVGDHSSCSGGSSGSGGNTGGGGYGNAGPREEDGGGDHEAASASPGRCLSLNYLPLRRRSITSVLRPRKTIATTTRGQTSEEEEQHHEVSAPIGLDDDRLVRETPHHHLRSASTAPKAAAPSSPSASQEVLPLHQLLANSDGGGGSKEGRQAVSSSFSSLEEKENVAPPPFPDSDEAKVDVGKMNCGPLGQRDDHGLIGDFAAATTPPNRSDTAPVECGGTNTLSSASSFAMSTADSCQDSQQHQQQQYHHHHHLHQHRLHFKGRLKDPGVSRKVPCEVAESGVFGERTDKRVPHL